MKNSVTRIDALSYAIDHIDDQSICEVLVKMKAQLEKQASAERKPSKADVARHDANEVLKLDIRDALATGEHLSVSDLIKRVPSLKGLSTQKVSALMRLLKLEGKVDKEMVKGTTYFFAI